jgi:methyl-accepting chemotaxis protein
MASDLNIIVGVHSGDAIRDLSNVRKQVDNVGGATKRTSGALKQHANQYNKTAVAVNKFGKGAMQQAGYQVADFAVQLQNGTSFLQAFGQQGSQMLAVFGPIGAVLGAGVAVASALGTVFQGLTGTTKSLNESLDGTKDAMSALNSSLDLSFTPLSDLDDKFGSFAGKVRELSEAQRMLNFQRTAIEIASSVKAIESTTERGKFKKLYDNVFNVGPAADNAGTAIKKLSKDFEITAYDAFELQKAFEKLANAGIGTEEKAEALLNLQKALQTVEPTTDEGVLALAKLSEQVGKGALSAYEYLAAMEFLAAGTRGVTEETKKLKVEIPKIAPEIQRINDAAKMVGSSFERSIMSMVKGTATAKDAFRAMAADIISELYRIFVVKQITGFITSSIQGAFMPREYSAPPVRPQATGGPVSAGSPYLVGERGPELMIPSRSGTIIPNNKLGGGGGVVVNQTINVTTGVQQTVRAEVLGLMPQIAEASKAAVLDAKRRGGAFGKAFS